MPSVSNIDAAAERTTTDASSLANGQVQVNHNGLPRFLASCVWPVRSRNGTVHDTCLPSTRPEARGGSTPTPQSIVKVQWPLSTSPCQVKKAHLGRERVRVWVFPDLSGGNRGGTTPIRLGTQLPSHTPRSSCRMDMAADMETRTDSPECLPEVFAAEMSLRKG